MNDAQVNYTVIEKELLAIVFAMEKFRLYLMGSKFDLEIVDRKGSENQVTDHLSHLEEERRPHDGQEINDSFPDEQLLSVSMNDMPWFANVANFLVTGIIPCELSSNQRKKLKRYSLYFYFDEPYLFKICTDGMIRRCVSEEEQLSILEACHSSPYGGHYGGERTASKFLSCGFYWPTLFKDAGDFVKRCDECQRASGISKKDEMPLNTILDIDIFYVWGIDFMGPFVSLCGNTYILMAVNYVSKWVEVMALPNNEARSTMVKQRGKGSKQAGRGESSRGGKQKSIRWTPQARQNIKNMRKMIKAVDRAIDQFGSKYEPSRDISSDSIPEYIPD
ncbi:uncharacterized protein [Nicotiana sylvestris]|uniref:uncharacterized protein n=1 Tax=Nicotiana sylvestris TaxID=4096 RepID=UPI00388CB53A